jgi:hypothetical protein
MPPQMTRRTRRNLTLVLSAFCLVALCLYKGTSPNDKAMVFALSVQAPNGDLLASPVVVGAAGQKVQVHLVCEKDPRAERMSLTLDPMGVEDGDLLYSYELSVAGRVQAEHGTVKLAVGRERKINVRPNDPRGGVTLSLYAAPLNHPGVERYLLQRKASRRLPAET